MSMYFTDKHTLILTRHKIDGCNERLSTMQTMHSAAINDLEKKMHVSQEKAQKLIAEATKKSTLARVAEPVPIIPFKAVVSPPTSGIVRSAGKTRASERKPSVTEIPVTQEQPMIPQNDSKERIVELSRQSTPAAETSVKVQGRILTSDKKPEVIVL